MEITKKEKDLLTDLRDEEELCVQKYDYYAEQACDSGLKELFEEISGDEESHRDSLDQLIAGKMPDFEGDEQLAEQYQPPKNYSKGSENSDDRDHDEFLCTDCITTEIYVSSAYNDDLFRFSDTGVRRLLNEIQTEEQQHAEMIYKYKTANGMTASN